MVKSYGVSSQAQVNSAEGLIIEEIENNGYSLVRNIVKDNDLGQFREKLDYLNEIQKKGLGEDWLASLNENNIVRLPLSSDDFFLKLIDNTTVLSIVRRIVGDFVTLHLQNGIINTPSEEHHQSSWHRDLPYQDFVISKPLSISVLYCIDDFNESTGGTFVLPFSHKIDHLPSEEYVKKNRVQIKANAGDAIVFDSMLYHRAGFNSSGRIRRGVNNVYTIPLIKQQINIPLALNGKYENDPGLAPVLGYTTIIPSDVNEFRKIREKKLLKS